MQDLLQLCTLDGGRQAVTAVLQQLVRDADVVKLTFGMEGDLRALSTALQSECGGSAFDHVSSHVDVRLLHAYLRQHGARLRPLAGNGLSGASHGALLQISAQEPSSKVLCCLRLLS